MQDRHRRRVLLAAAGLAVAFLVVAVVRAAVTSGAGDEPTTVARTGAVGKAIAVAVVFTAFLIVPGVAIAVAGRVRKEKGRLRWWQRLALLLLPLLVLAGALAYLATMVRIPDLEALWAAIPQYRAVGDVVPGDAYLRGRAVIVQEHGDDLHDLFGDLPEELTAYTPEEVSTVVVVDCAADVRGHLVSVVETKKICDSSSCDLRVIDWTLPAVVATRSFDWYGCAEGLEDDMLGYLLSLPRRGA
ncbi:MAG: hypothetical protein ABIJ48_12135 [Actinomycetota bacterium]